MFTTTSEVQILATQPQDPGDDLKQVSLLRHRVSAGEPFAADSFIQEADAYSAAPVDLVRHHAVGTDLGDGKGTAWFFCSPANYHRTPGARRRKRKVGGGADAGDTYWRVEKGAPILGPDKKSVGAHKRTLSFVQKIKNPPGTAKPFRSQALGWIMVEIELDQPEDADCPDQQLVLCKVYRSSRTDAAEATVPDVPCTTGMASPPQPPPPPPPPAATKSSWCDNQQLPTECKTAFDHNVSSPVVAQKPALSKRPAFEPGEGAKITGGVAIVKKGSLTAAVTVVMKFGGSSMKSADHMKEMAKLVFSFPASGGNPVVVLSAMWNTTTNLLVAAGKALSCDAKESTEIHELAITKKMHFRMIEDLGLDKSIVSGSFDELENVFMGINMMKELTSNTRDYLVSFGENASTRIFSAYLNKLEKGNCQEWESYAVNTCGRGGSDLTATTIGRDLGSREIQVWKDVDGVLTCDPNVCANAIPLPYLTFDEAAELGLLGAQSVQLAMEGGIRLTVKNLRNPQAPGTLITATRDMRKIILTSIVLKSNVTMLNIKRRRMLGQSVFFAMSFSILEKLGKSANCVATSEGKISLITVPSKASSHDLIQLELDNVVGELKEIAVVDRLEDRAVISLIGNAQMSHLVLEKVSNVLSSINVKAQMISQASSEVMKISMVVNDDEAEHCVQALHSAFFENDLLSEAQVAENKRPIPSAAASSSGVKKRKAGGPSVIECTPFPDNGLIMPDVGGDNNPVPIRVDNEGLVATGALPQPQVVHPEQPSGVDANHGAQEEYNRIMAFLDHDSPMPVRGDNGSRDPFGWFAGILEPGDYSLFDDSGLDIPILNAEAEQQGRLAEAAEGGSPVVTEEEEVIEVLIAGATPDELFGQSALPSSLHVAGECQAAYCGLCFREETGI